MLKGVDVARSKAIVDFLNDNFTPGEKSAWAGRGRRRLLDFRWLCRRHRPPARRFKAQIIDGTIVVPTEPAAWQTSPANLRRAQATLGPAFYLGRLTGGEMSAAPAIELKGVTKRYPGVVANKDVELKSVPAKSTPSSGRTVPASRL